MKPGVRRAIEIAGWTALALPALYQIILLCTAIGGRVAYPYDLEWMEGGMLHHALRIQEGRGIYGPPSTDFIPYLYTPLYPSVLALFGGIFGLTYALGRAVSILSLLGIDVSLLTATLIEAFSTAVRFATFMVPASLGALEGGNVALFGALGLGATAGMSFSLVRRLREATWIGIGFLALAAYRGLAPAAALSTPKG